MPEIDEWLLDCILKSLFMIGQSLRLYPMDASTIYSVGILQTCIGAKDALFDHTVNVDAVYEDIDSLIRSKQQLQIIPTGYISSSFQVAANRIVEYFKKCHDCFPSKSDRIFWKLKHHCIWMWIYWLSDTFEDFSDILKVTRENSIHSVSQNCLIVSSFLKGDAKFSQKLISLPMDSKLCCELSCAFDNLDILEVAIEENDIVLLQILMKNTEEKILIQKWQKLWRVAQIYDKFDAMDILLSSPGMSSDFVYRTFWELVFLYDWRRLQRLWNFLGARVENISSMRHPLPLEWDTSILLNFVTIIHEGNLQDLEQFSTIIRQSRTTFNDSLWKMDVQLAMLPALASRRLSILKFLSEKRLVQFFTATGFPTNLSFFLERFPKLSITEISEASMFEWPLSLAIGLVLDLEVIEYLCHNGARLTKSVMFGKSGILEKLRLTIAVSDARKQMCHVKGYCYKLCFVEARDKYNFSNNGDWIFRTWHGSIVSIWKIMCRIVFENDCRDLYDITSVVSELTWLGIQKRLYSEGLENLSIKKAASWPAPLLTQESWDEWKLNVIDILENTHQE